MRCATLGLTILIWATMTNAAAAGTAFTYQGRLLNAGTNLTGNRDHKRNGGDENDRV